MEVQLAATRLLWHLHPLVRQLGSPPFKADEDLQDMENILVMDMSPMHGGGFEQVLSDDDGLATSTVSSAIVRSKDFVGANAGLCVPRQKAVFVSWISLT